MALPFPFFLVMIFGLIIWFWLIPHLLELLFIMLLFSLLYQTSIIITIYTSSTQPNSIPLTFSTELLAPHGRTGWGLEGWLAGWRI